MISFDERARDWDSDPATVERALVVANAIHAQIPHKVGMTALEYGCGTGLLSFALQKDFAAITLADTSQGMLHVLAGKIKTSGVLNMQALRLDLTNDPAPAAHFDVIYLLMSMHHIPDTAAVLRKFHGMATTGGFLCIADLDEEDGSFHGPDVKDVHKGFAHAALQLQVEDAGFGQARFTSVYTIKKQVGGLEKQFPMFLMLAQNKQ